jgi:hypothetical protein
MEVKSKFNKGDIIFFMIGDQPHKAEIIGITFFTGTFFTGNNGSQTTAGDFTQVKYHTDGCDSEVPEQNAFTSKEELTTHVFNGLRDHTDYSPFNAPVKGPKD